MKQAKLLTRPLTQSPGPLDALKPTFQMNWKQWLLGRREVTLSLACVVAAIFFQFLSPYFFTVQNLVTIFLNSVELLLVSLGISFILATAGIDMMDILPMYILFSFLTPAAFGAAQRWGWKMVLFVSFSGWVIAQTHVREMLVTASKDLPFVQLGPFDLLAWQFLWVGGLFVGQRFLERKSLLPLPHLLRPLLVLSTIAFLFGRWSAITSGPEPALQTWLQAL